MLKLALSLSRIPMMLLVLELFPAAWVAGATK